MSERWCDNCDVRDFEVSDVRDIEVSDGQRTSYINAVAINEGSHKTIPDVRQQYCVAEQGGVRVPWELGLGYLGSGV